MKLNLPNKITLLRILMIPVVIFIYLQSFMPYSMLIAMFVFIIASSTDFIDGNIARKKNMVTTLGKFLDPIADKLLNVAMLILLVRDTIFPYYILEISVIIIVSRELVIGGFRQLAASKNIIISADKMGKLKAVFQDIFISLMLFVLFLKQANIESVIFSIMYFITLVVLLITVVLTVYSLVNYFIKNKNVVD